MKIFNFKHIKIVLTMGFFMLSTHAMAVSDLQQADFDCGTLILKEPGVYRLMEDIQFPPLSA